MKYLKLLLIVRFFLVLIGLLITSQAYSSSMILIPMDTKQSSHLKAYGVTFRLLKKNIKGHWVLNYRGGSFIFPNQQQVKDECAFNGVSYELISDSVQASIDGMIEKYNMRKVELNVAPKIAVYTPVYDDGKEVNEPWDDAVTLVLTYANIEYDPIYDDYILNNDLKENYDWIHLHHEDFSGQYGKFIANYGNTDWYQEMVYQSKLSASKAGYVSVQQHKCGVAKKFRSFIEEGGFLFAMCAATDSMDIALAAEGIDIIDPAIDETPISINFQTGLDFSKTLFFENFRLIPDPWVYEFSDIDLDTDRDRLLEGETFTLFDFSAKADPIPSILTQNHTQIVKDFHGQTTGFKKSKLKSSATILGYKESDNWVKYIYTGYGKGFVSFYGGHDPEDFIHYIYDPPTKLEQYPNSAGYRLILNNILLPATKQQKRKT